MSATTRSAVDSAVSPVRSSPAGLVLAAGEGRRFGRPKALVTIGGERLVDRAVRLLREGGCVPIVVVAGAVSLEVPGTLVVENTEWRAGMGTSLRVGLAALPAESAAVVVALVDQPWLGPESVRRLAAAHGTGARVAVATYDGRRGNPVLLDRSVWTDVDRLAEGDIGARAFMRAFPDAVVEVPCDGTGRPDDVDRPGDLPTEESDDGPAAGAERDDQRDLHEGEGEEHHPARPE